MGEYRVFYSVNKIFIQKEALLQAKEDIFKRQKNKIYILINTFVFCNMQNNNERIFFFWRFSNRMKSLVVKIVSKNLLDLCLWKSFFPLRYAVLRNFILITWKYEECNWINYFDDISNSFYILYQLSLEYYPIFRGVE